MLNVFLCDFLWWAHQLSIPSRFSQHDRELLVKHASRKTSASAGISHTRS